MLIERNKSIIVSCDVSSNADLDKLIKKTHGSEFVGAYKVGLELVIKFGLTNIVSLIKSYTDKPVIYDHQKAGNDIPEMGKKFANSCNYANVDSVILFPFAGPITQYEWIKACKDAGLHVIVGGEMTHKGFTEYINGDVSINIYENAVEQGITDFVVPGNKPNKIGFYKDFIIGTQIENPIFYSPGLITQGGDISESGKIAGDNWHCIIGRAIYEAENISEKIEELSQQL